MAKRWLGAATSKGTDSDRVSRLILFSSLASSRVGRSPSLLCLIYKETIVRLLYSLASKREVSRYLQIFSSATHFAVLKVGGAILTHDLESLTLSLNFLHRVGLYPVVVHGMGDKLNARLEADGIVPDYIDGTLLHFFRT